ncbi:MAG TPA: hypothetical protein VF186_06760 [Gaiellaceae bacterium]|jgi:hypothetical protein
MALAEEPTSRWRAVPVPSLSGLTVEWAGRDGYVLSRRAALYRTCDPAVPFERLGHVPLPPPLRLGARIELVRRALRLAYYNVVLLSDERILATFNRSVALITPEGTRPVAGLERPFRVLRGGCALRADGSAWFGEYLILPELTPLHVYRLAGGAEQAEIVHVFPAGFARHIHGLYSDPVDGSLWCLTGDHAEHARIMWSPDGLERFVTVGRGDESWRAVSMQFRGDAVYYATDAQLRQNWIYRIDRSSGTRREVAPLDGPVYYSHRVGDDLFFAVSAELGSGGRGRSATLWHLDPDDRCSRVASFAKDRWPVAQFLPGTLSFPQGSGDGSSFYFSGVALSGIGGTTFRCSPIDDRDAAQAVAPEQTQPPGMPPV